MNFKTQNAVKGGNRLNRSLGCDEKLDIDKDHFTSFAYMYIKGNILNELGKNLKLEERTVCIGEYREFFRLYDPNL